MEFINIEPDVLALRLTRESGSGHISDAASRMNQMLEYSDQLKLYLEIPHNKEDNEGLLIEGLKNALQNFSPFAKIAVVSHESWIERYSEVLMEVGSTQLEVFGPEEAEQAREWLKGTTSGKENTIREPDRPPKRDAPDQDLNRT